MDNNAMFRPFFATPLIPDGDSLSFRDDHGNIIEFECNGHSSDIWDILRFCDGSSSIDDICSLLPNIDVKSMINDLVEIGIVTDYFDAFMRLNSMMEYPDPYSSHLSTSDIVELENSPRYPFKDGEILTFDVNKVSLSIRDIQATRSSCRNFSNLPLSLSQIGSILDAGYSMERHATPSAGNLYPCKIFVVVIKDQLDIPVGLYEYNNEDSCLVKFGEYSHTEMMFALNTESSPFNAPVFFIVAANVKRQSKKYGNRAYRFSLLEAGAISQNITLAAEELHIGSCQLGGASDREIRSLLKINDDILPLITIAIGNKSSNESVVSHELNSEQLINGMVGEQHPAKKLWFAESSYVDTFEKKFYSAQTITANKQITGGHSTSQSSAIIKSIAEAHERSCSGNIFWDKKIAAKDISEQWVDPRLYCPLSDEQYSKLRHLQPFSENLEIEWVYGKTSSNESILIPVDMVFYPFHGIHRKPIIAASSSGVAAHMSTELALKSAILELVERDALMRMWMSEDSPNILSTPPTSYLANRSEYWNRFKKKVTFLDLSVNGIAVVCCIIFGDKFPRFTSGASASDNSIQVAAEKAFQEAEASLIHSLNYPEQEKLLLPEQVFEVSDHEMLFSQTTKITEVENEKSRLISGTRVDSVTKLPGLSLRQLIERYKIVSIDLSDNLYPLKVVRALSPKLIPINFGISSEHFTHPSLLNARRVEVPHFFA